MTKKDYNIKELQVLKDNQLADKHQNDLGLKVPNDYFKKSKARILDEIIEEKSVAYIPIRRNKYTWMAVAATIAVIFSVTIFNKSIFKTDTNKIVSDTLNSIKNIELNEENLVLLNSDDITITSLFVEDSKIDEYLDTQMLEDLIDEDLLLN